MGKQIVICCDGTANQYGNRNTNVLRIYEVLAGAKTGQTTFYDTGVGTFVAMPMTSKVGTLLKRNLDMAVGRGFAENVLEAYRFLSRTYVEGDEIFMFGFSRGAFAVRVLAGLILKMGLLNEPNLHLAPYAGRLYKNRYNQRYGISTETLSGFKDAFSRECKIRFLGLWDTVSSYGWAWNPISFPNTRNNEIVDFVRHAVSIDERRAFFRQNLWGADSNRGTDVKEVWFAGCHSDVGGASDLSRHAFEWILVEAVENGLKVETMKVNRELSLRSPTVETPISESLRCMWHLAEYYPKPVSRQDDAKSVLPRFRMNRRSPRSIPEGARIHKSALDRRSHGKYSPPNWPTNFVVENYVPFK